LEATDLGRSIPLPVISPTLTSGVLAERVTPSRIFDGLLSSLLTRDGPFFEYDYPVNLSILITGGKETKRDIPSNGE
jgi:hypothetical protein